MIQRLTYIYYKETDDRGRGVFTARSINAGDVIEICPIVVIPKAQIEILDQTVLYDYYFLWENNNAAIALGYGSLYNHSYSPNAEYIMDFVDSSLIIQAIKDINAHEEITFNYNGDPVDDEELWFKTI